MKKLTVQNVKKTMEAVVLCALRLVASYRPLSLTSQKTTIRILIPAKTSSFTVNYPMTLSVEGQWLLRSHYSVKVIVLLRSQSSHYCCSFDGTGHLLLFYYIVSTVASCSFE